MLDKIINVTKTWNPAMWVGFGGASGILSTFDNNVFLAAVGIIGVVIIIPLAIITTFGE